MELIFHPAAPKDAGAIAGKYAAVSDELAARFWQELDLCIETIANFPERHHYDPSGFRRANLARFPYHILFEENPGCIRIMVIRHHRRRPGFGLRRR